MPLVLVFGSFLVAEAITRSIFNIAIVWVLDMSKFLFIAYFLLAVGYAFVTDAHVRMDVFFSRWSDKTKAIVDIATFFFIPILCGVLIWQGFVAGVEALATGEHTASQARIPLAPVKFTFAAAFTILLLQTIAILINDLLVLFRGRGIE